MVLTKDNLAAWKEEIRHLAFDTLGFHYFDTTLTDEEWIENYLGRTTDDAVLDEKESLADN